MPSALNYPEWTGPVAPETKIFRAAEAVFKGDPFLPSFVETWASWRGEDIDLVQLKDISHTQCPFLRLSPYPVASDMETEISHRAPMMIRCEMAVVGTNSDVLMNFWHVVRRAIYPQNNTALRDDIMAVFHQFGAQRPVIKMNAYGAWQDKDEWPILAAEGSIQFYIEIPT